MVPGVGRSFPPCHGGEGPDDLETRGFVPLAVSGRMEMFCPVTEQAELTAVGRVGPFYHRCILNSVRTLIKTLMTRVP